MASYLFVIDLVNGKRYLIPDYVMAEFCSNASFKFREITEPLPFPMLFELMYYHHVCSCLFSPHLKLMEFVICRLLLNVKLLKAIFYCWAAIDF